MLRCVATVTAPALLRGPAFVRRGIATAAPATASTPPAASAAHSYGIYLTTLAPRLISSFTLSHATHLTLHTAPATIVPLLTLLRDHSHARFQLLVDICGVDYPTRGQHRFEVVYNLLSVRHNARITVKTSTDEVTPIPSAVPVFSSADWMERETYDMFGIIFEGHPDLRRILTDYGFEGYPLRKDFPLTGYSEVRYDETRKRVVSEKLELAQAYRVFDAKSPWEQTGEGQQVDVNSEAAAAPRQ